MKKLLSQMWKLYLLAAVIVALFGAKAFAGHFTDVLPPASASGSVPVSNGYDYNLSGDSGAPSPVFAAPISPFVRTAAQIAALTPGTTGQMIVISNPANFNAGKDGLCISSGTTVGAWIAVSSATAVTACQ